MIPFEFESYSPKTEVEAVEIYMTAKSDGLIPVYFSGGTEFISRARRSEMKADVIINLKEIKACQSIRYDEKTLIIGSAVTLTEIIDENPFPLLSDVARSIATQTARNKITIGGNIMSNLPYKEALLPFLLANSDVVIASNEGVRQVNIHDIYTDEFNMRDEEWIVQIITAKKMVEVPYYHDKRTRQSRVNYPLVTTTSLFMEEEVRIAMSGMYANPIRNQEIEHIANRSSKNKTTQIEEMMEKLPEEMTDNPEGSAAYRKFILAGMFAHILKRKGALSI